MSGGQGRIAGSILVVAGAVVLVGVGALLAAQVRAGETTGPGAILGFVLALIVFGLPLLGGGTWLLRKSRVEASEMAESQRLRRVLGMVGAQGKVTLVEVAVELGVTRDAAEDLVRDLVSRDLFEGAIDWKSGTLWSKEAAASKGDRTCPSCGGTVELAGKGVMACAYCGTEMFTA